jgi:hypothetical protein
LLVQASHKAKSVLQRFVLAQSWLSEQVFGAHKPSWQYSARSLQSVSKLQSVPSRQI